MYSASFFFFAPSGLTLKWSLSAAGTLHATLRNQTTGFTEQGTSGLYEWVVATIPDSYRGCVVWHTNTLTALSDLVAATTYGGGSINPGEIEYPESMWARLGAFTGTGVNTVLGFFKALLSKTATTPSDVGGTFDPATDSTEAIRDRGDVAWLASSQALASGTFAAATSTTATLDAGAVANADYYVNELLVTKTGTGAGQSRIITAYTVGRQATVAAWDVTPDNTTTYEVRTGRVASVSRTIEVTTRNVRVTTN